MDQIDRQRMTPRRRQQRYFAGKQASGSPRTQHAKEKIAGQKKKVPGDNRKIVRRKKARAVDPQRRKKVGGNHPRFENTHPKKKPGGNPAGSQRKSRKLPAAPAAGESLCSSGRSPAVSSIAQPSRCSTPKTIRWPGIIRKVTTVSSIPQPSTAIPRLAGRRLRAADAPETRIKVQQIICCQQKPDRSSINLSGSP